MRKMIGMFSLIAITMVAFTSQANANESPPDYAIVCYIGYSGDKVVSIEVVELGVFNVADETVKDLGVEDLCESGNLVTGRNSNYFILSVAFILEPDPDLKRINICSNYNSVTDTYRDVEKPVGWC